MGASVVLWAFTLVRQDFDFDFKSFCVVIWIWISNQILKD